MRYISFGGYTNMDYGLTLSGNTPLIIPKPKNSSVEVPYANGTVDTSELTGTLYFNNSDVKYQLVAYIPTWVNGVARTTDVMNSLVTQKINDVMDWLHSGPALLIDTGLPRDISNADCINLEVDKTVLADYWVVKFVAQFSGDAIPLLATPPYEARARVGRFIVYNGRTSIDVGLDMVGLTPVTVINPKVKSASLTNKNGTLNLSHCRDGKTSGKDSLFYQDATITYKFTKFFKTKEGSTTYGQEAMNRRLQTYVEEVCAWLYLHPNASFITIDGNVSYGGDTMMLMDSAWIDGPVPSSGNVNCGFLPSARVTDLNIEKTVFPDRWGLMFEITFTTYPEFFYGNLYLPPITDPTPAPVITFTEWKHYAEVSVNERFDEVHMVEYDENDDFYMGEGIYVSYDNVDATRSYVQVTSSQDYANETYLQNTGSPTLTAKVELDIPALVHSSIVNEENAYALMLTVPPTIELTCGNKTLNYILYFNTPSQVTHYERASTKFDFKYDEGGTSPFTADMPTMLFVDSFTPTIEVTLLAVSESGTIAGDYFTPQEMAENYPVLEIPMTAHYIQKISGDNILTDYGIWGEYETDVPDNYYILKAKNMNYSSDETIPEYNMDTLVPYNVSEVGDDVKFKHPSYYYETGVAVTLKVASENGNNYIFCDSKRPEGGDIQCL